MRVALILLLAMCAFTTAMVRRDKRALNTEEEHPSSATVASSTKPASSAEGRLTLCQPSTPCAWSLYKPHIKIIDLVVNSTYCVCSPHTNCVITEDDIASNAYVHRCRPPGSPDDISGTR